MIVAKNLRKTYGQIIAVSDVSFEIGKGEMFGLLGPNGAGKSTTIGMLVGAVNPDSGSVDLDGLGSPSNPKVRKKIGLAPQSLAVYEELTAAENLAFYGQI